MSYTTDIGKNLRQIIIKATTYYDENRNQWNRLADGNGRLVNVTELGNATNPVSWPTQYKYDALGNLIDVIQSGAPGDTARTRHFSYDSLSHLITANNPETGTICYGKYDQNGNCSNGYDANGNLLAKTDARGITVNYHYDALNRLIAKTYDGEPANAPKTLSSCYLYDSETNGGSNTNGRLASEWTQPGNCPGSSSGLSSAAVSWKDGLSYDAMGRIVSELQCAFLSCTSSQFQHSYDLAGSLRYTNNGLSGSQSPQFGWTNTYDSTGHLQTTISSWSDPTHPANLFQADATAAGLLNASTAYSASGGLAAALYGIDSTANTVALSDARTYDNRLRLITKTVSGAAATMLTTTSAMMSPASFPLSGSSTATVHVNCNSACGQVDIVVDGIDLGLQTLDASGNASIPSAAFPPSTLTSGIHTLTVLYPGNGTYASSQGTASYTVTTQTAVNTITVRFTNDSCSACSGQPQGGGDRDLYVNSITVGGTTIQPAPSTVTYSSSCGAGIVLACNSDMTLTMSEAAGPVIVNAFGTPDLDIYPHMQVLVNGVVVGEWDVTGTAQDYSVSAQITVRFTNDSCSGCSGQPQGGGDRNLYVNSITVGATTIQPAPSTVTYSSSCGAGIILPCNSDMTLAAFPAAAPVTINAFGTPDLDVYPHMQVLVNGSLVGEWDVTGSAQNYTIGADITANYIGITTTP